MGIEGASAEAYYRCYAKIISQNLSFKRRTKHPPLDPVNALLSLGYVLITNEIAALAESNGLDPFIGFLHSLRYGRQSLPLDLMEEFRHPVIDGLVQTMVNKGVIKEEDFHRKSNGAYLLNEGALKIFFGLYEERMEKQFLDRKKDTYTSYRKLFRRQVDNIKRTLLDMEKYQPFLVR